MLAQMAQGPGVLPRAGGVMDQDPYELFLLRIGVQVLSEKEEQEDKRRQREAKAGR